MFTRPVSRLLASAVLASAVGTSGCRGTGCPTCQQHGCPQGYSSSANVYEMHEHQPGWGPGGEYQLVPQDSLQPVPPPSPMPESVPRHNLDSSGLGQPGTSASYRLQPQYDQSAVSQQPRRLQPVAEPAETQQKLVPHALTPQFFKPAGEKLRSMFDSVRDKMPRLTWDDRQEGRAAGQEPAGKMSLAGELANPPAVLARPEFGPEQHLLTADALDPFAATRQAMQQTQHLTTKPVSPEAAAPSSWGTHLPRQWNPSTLKEPAISVPTGPVPIEQWPYSPGVPQPIPAGAGDLSELAPVPQRAPSSVPPQGLGL